MEVSVIFVIFTTRQIIDKCVSFGPCRFLSMVYTYDMYFVLVKVIRLLLKNEASLFVNTILYISYKNQRVHAATDIPIG